MSLLSLVIGLAATAQTPLNIPTPSQEEVVACVPPEYRAATSIDGIPRAAIRAIVACAQALAARHINANAPYQIDPITTLVSVETSGTTLRYNNRVDVDGGEVTDAQRAAVEASVRAKACDSPDMRQTMTHGGAYEYVWRDRAGALVHQVRIERCP